MHYQLRLQILKEKKLRLPEDTIITAGLVGKMVLEIIVVSLCCPPLVDFHIEGRQLGGRYTYSWCAILSVFTLCKSYLVLRLYQQYSRWTDEKAIRVCKKYKCQANVSFAIKSELKKRPYFMLSILMIVTIIYLGFALRTFEISYSSQKAGSFEFRYLLNSFWLIIITMTTVGFGDGFPSTHLGRFIGVIACIIGMLLVSLMVVSLTVSSEFTAEEAKAYSILKKMYADDNAKEKAANVVRTLLQWRVNQLKSGDLVESFVWNTKLKRNIEIFKNDYRLANSHNLSVDEMLKNLRKKLESDISDIKKEVIPLTDLEKRCSELKERQVKISSRLDEIINIQASIAEFLIKLNSMNAVELKNKKL
eukprot:TRINITY_DN5341_c0_g1_i6.p1 TRINITY_DN5341_c0_g1~~TRINITY_DN5341_c0_g1_i6.p1  ORF type:complete len:363 (-),score=66.29 TRINITY_DN5341_c0_g1_i6:330-1418(-)